MDDRTRPAAGAVLGVAGACPPLAVLLAVELLNKAPIRHRETIAETKHDSETETTEIPETTETKTDDTRDRGETVDENDARVVSR